jgi:hypothetical protein
VCEVEACWRGRLSEHCRCGHQPHEQRHESIGP